MVSLAEKIGSATAWAVVRGAGGIAVGYAFGYIYAKLSDLPAGVAAKAFAVGFAAIAAIDGFVSTMTKGIQHAHYINRGVYTLLHCTYIYEMRRRGLMGDKLLIISSISLAYSIWSALFGQKLMLDLSKPIPVISIISAVCLPVTYELQVGSYCHLIQTSMINIKMNLGWITK